MENNEALFGALSLCRKAGQLVMGFDAVCEDVFRGRVALVLTASDISPKTLARMQRACEDLVPMVSMPIDQLTLCSISRKPVGIYGIKDENLARLCRKYLAQSEEQNKEETAHAER